MLPFLFFIKINYISREPVLYLIDQHPKRCRLCNGGVRDRVIYLLATEGTSGIFSLIDLNNGINAQKSDTVQECDCQ